MGDITLAPAPQTMINAARSHSNTVRRKNAPLTETIASLDRTMVMFRDKPSLLGKAFNHGSAWSAEEACKAIALAFEQLHAEGIELVKWPDTKDGPETATLAQHPTIYAVKVSWGGVTSVITAKEGQGGKIGFKVGIPTEYAEKIGEVQFDVQPDAAIGLAAGEVVKLAKAA